VELQHERLTTKAADHHTRTDLNFYVIAVDNLVDAVKVTDGSAEFGALAPSN
jgi:hypothetical protein